MTTFDAGGGLIGVSARPAEDGTVRIFGGTGAAAGAGAGPGAEDERGGGESGREADGGDPGGSSPGQDGAAADPWILAVAAGIAAAGAGAAAYLAWARRRSPR